MDSATKCSLVNSLCFSWLHPGGISSLGFYTSEKFVAKFFLGRHGAQLIQHMSCAQACVKISPHIFSAYTSPHCPIKLFKDRRSCTDEQLTAHRFRVVYFICVCIHYWYYFVCPVVGHSLFITVDILFRLPSVIYYQDIIPNCII